MSLRSRLLKRTRKRLKRRLRRKPLKTKRPRMRLQLRPRRPSMKLKLRPRKTQLRLPNRRKLIMARDILSEYGKDSNAPMAPRAKSGGITMGDKRDVMGYSPPQGPTNINDAKSPGLHGHNCGNSGTQGASESRGDGAGGRPGLGGRNLGNDGSQR